MTSKAKQAGDALLSDIRQSADPFQTMRAGFKAIAIAQLEDMGYNNEEAKVMLALGGGVSNFASLSNKQS